jgi:hypothetical protein
LTNAFQSFFVIGAALPTATEGNHNLLLLATQLALQHVARDSSAALL